MVWLSLLCVCPLGGWRMIDGEYIISEYGALKLAKWQTHSTVPKRSSMSHHSKKMGSKSFFNLPEATLRETDGVKHRSLAACGQHSVGSNWYTCEEQSMNKQSLIDVFAGTAPVIRESQFLSQEECAKMVKVLTAHKLVRQHNSHHRGL